MSRNKKQATGRGDDENPEICPLHNETRQSIHYEICVQGEVSDQWFDCFDGLVFQILENNRTLIRANLTDKSALHGLLTRIGELNLTVLSVNKIGGTVRPNEN